MSELLDKQVNVQKESLKITSRIHASSHKPAKICAIKSKRPLHKNFCGEWKDFIRPYQKNGWTNFYQLQDIDSSNNEGTNSLVNGQTGWERMVHHAQSHNGRHKAHNGWYLGMVVPISSILGLLVLYSKNVVSQ